MQETGEISTAYQLIGVCVALGAAGFKYYQHITAGDEATIRREQEMVSIQREQIAELREMTTELDDLTSANATLLQDSDAQLRELEALLFPEDPPQKKKGTSTRDLLNTLNHNQPNLRQNLSQEEATNPRAHYTTEETENSVMADLIILEDYPSEELSQRTPMFNL